MKDRKKGNAMNDETNLQPDTLTDLPVTDEQANQTRAGDGASVAVFNNFRVQYVFADYEDAAR